MRRENVNNPAKHAFSARWFAGLFFIVRTHALCDCQIYVFLQFYVLSKRFGIDIPSSTYVYYSGLLHRMEGFLWLGAQRQRRW